jgi:hypothetical protein
MFLSVNPNGPSSGFVPPTMPKTSTNFQQTVKVLVIDLDPPVPSHGNQPVHQVFGWTDPHTLASGYQAAMEYASGGAVKFQIAQWRNLNDFPAAMDGTRYTPDSYVQFEQTATDSQVVPTDFYRFAKEQGLAQLVNSGAIDEVWLFAPAHFDEFGEDWMFGPGSFFINGPTFPNIGTDRPIAGYGFNYERGVAEMIHDSGHRLENIMQDYDGGTWNQANPQTAWEKFSAVAGKTSSNIGGVGNTHFPFNGTTDYDYGDSANQLSTSADWLNYPNLTGKTQILNDSAWSVGDNPDYQKDYLEWMFGHLPRNTGTTSDGRQNNWWKYLYDFNSYSQTTGLPRKATAVAGVAPVTTAGTAKYDFTVRYYDTGSIDTSTIDGKDILVTGPHGFSQLASVVGIGPSQKTTAGTACTVTYAITPPGKAWDSTDNGTYSLAIRSNQVRTKTGTYVPSGTLNSFSVSITSAGPKDTTAPTASLTAAPKVTAQGTADEFISVRFTDSVGVDVSTINSADLLITGPGSFKQQAIFYSLNNYTNGTNRTATYFLLPPGGAWDYKDDGTYSISLQANKVADTSGNFIKSTKLLGTFTVAVPAPSKTPPADFTENNASQWVAYAQDGNASVSNDTSKKLFGTSSIRFDTDGGFDTSLRFPPAGGADWDITADTKLNFSVFASNTNQYGFQQNSPVIRIYDTSGNYFEYSYFQDGSQYQLLNDALGQWNSYSVPIASPSTGVNGWVRTSFGNVDLHHIAAVEFHADTWGNGFTLWYDGVGFQK